MIRDHKSKALINDNISELNNYKAERNKIRKLDMLSKEVSDIRETLSSICERLKKLESI